MPVNLGKTCSMRIIEALADEQPLTVYGVAKKSGIAVSFVHRVIKQPKVGLKALNIVKAYSSGTWRTGLERVEYILTFRGLLEYFNLLFEKKRTKETFKIREAIRKNGRFYNYPVFSEIDYLEAWLGARVYDFICSSAWMVRNYPPSIPIITDTVSGQLPSFVKDIMEGRLAIPPEAEEKILMHAYTLLFFDVATLAAPKETTETAPNPALFKLADDTYTELKAALDERITTVAKLEFVLKKKFGPLTRIT